MERRRRKQKVSECGLSPRNESQGDINSYQSMHFHKVGSEVPPYPMPILQKFMPAAVGLRVIRGPGWSHGEADDGEGHVGTIAAAGSDKKSHVVTWDGGQQTTVRAGSSDLRVLDNATVGVCHPGVTCDECQESNIVGIRWKCSECFDYDLCSMCYFNDSHDRSHQFDRIETPGGEPVKMEKRTKSLKMGILGIYPDSTVVRGRDWEWGSQDGGKGNEGTVTELLTPDTNSARSTVRVKWLKSDKSNVYRLGYRGKMDLQYTEESPGGECYPHHLPVFDNSTYVQDAVEQTSQAALQSSVISTGDKIYVDLPSDRVRELRSSGGKVAELLGKVGVVEGTTPGGEVIAVFQYNEKFKLSLDVVKKVPKLTVGDRVRVLSDEVKVAAFQSGHGGFNKTMRSALGKVGEVIKIDGDGDVEVRFDEQKWCFNVICLTPAPGQSIDVVPRGGGGGGDGDDSESGESGINMLGQLLQAVAMAAAVQTAQAAGGLVFIKAVIENNVSAVRQMLQREPRLVEVKEQGVGAIHLAANLGHLQMTQLLLEKGAKLEEKDKDGDTALLAGMKHHAIADFLIKKGSDVKAFNDKGHTASMLATAFGHVQILRLLMAKGADFNAQDKGGYTAIHHAIESSSTAAAEVLIGWPRIDLRSRNKNGFPLLHFAAFKGDASIAELLLRKDRSLANDQKEDGFTAMHVAALNNHTDVMKVLIEKGKANVDIRTQKRQSALHLAATEAYMDAVQLLIKHGADLEAKDCDGDRPFHILMCSHTNRAQQQDLLLLLLGAASKVKVEERVRIACYMLQAGASPQARNDNGKTPLEVCGNQSIVDGVKRFLAANPSLNRPPMSMVQRQTSANSEVQLCQKCCLRRAAILLVPCGHRVVCTQCCAKLQSCPQCNGFVRNMYDENGKEMKDKCSVM